MKILAFDIITEKVQVLIHRTDIYFRKCYNVKRSTWY